MWPFKIAQADMNGVLECDAIFAVVNGVPPDEGVAFELGVAAAASGAGRYVYCCQMRATCYENILSKLTVIYAWFV